MKNIITFVIMIFCIGCDERVSREPEKIPGNKIEIGGRECEVVKVSISNGPMLYVLDCKDKVSVDYSYRSGKQTYHVSSTQQTSKPIESVAPLDGGTVTPSSSKQISIIPPAPTQFNFKNCKLDGEILTCTK